MLEGLSTNVLSSHLRTAISDGLSSNYQKEIEKVSYSENATKENAAKQVNDPSKEDVKQVVNSMNTFLQPTHTSVRFEYHEKLHEYFVKVVDSTTSETIREIPPKKLLDFYAAMTEFVGLMVDKKI